MKLALITLLVIFIGFGLIFLFACCKVSGDCSREEDERDLDKFFEERGIRKEDVSE